MDQVFSKENKTLKKYWKIGKNTGKVREKSGNFVSPEKWEPCGNPNESPNETFSTVHTKRQLNAATARVMIT